MSPIVHVVLFEFNEGTSQDTRKEVCERLLDLKEECKHPKTGLPYIKSFTGGRDNSPEGRQRGMTHAFVLEFENEEDRLHYVEKDTAHQAFIKSLDGMMADVQVLDYTPGVY